MSDRAIISIREYDLGRCIYFSRKSAGTQQPVEFGQSDTQARDPREIARDNIIGKMAEIAFAEYVWNGWSRFIEPDYRIMPRGQWDAQDAQINGWRIDIKATRGGGKWLLVDWNKLRFRAAEGKLPHAFVLSCVPWDRDADTPRGSVELVGVASLRNLVPGPTTHVFRKGDSLPNTSMRFQADNFGIHADAIRDNLYAAVDFMFHNPPPATEAYQRAIVSGDIFNQYQEE